MVTGLGVLSAAGCGVEALWQAVCDARPGARLLETPRAAGGAVTFAGCPAAPVDWSGHPWQAMARRLDPSGQYALAAAHQAAEQAGLFRSAPEPHRLGVIMGSSRGPKSKREEAHALLAQGRRLKPTLAATTTLSAAPGALAQVLQALGPCWLVSTACASGAHALMQAAEQIALGHADVMVAGGADGPLNEALLSGLGAAGVLAEREGTPAQWFRPFGLGRSGFVPGEGAAVLVLESASSARQRGAVPLAVLGGWSALFAPEGLVGIAADGQGIARAMRAAVETAGLSPTEIGYINAHGTGTSANDLAEAAAIAEVFGEASPPCSSTKPITGHCLGATPVMEAVICIEALRRGELPPAFPVGGQDPACPVRLSPGGPQPALRHTLSHSAAFWGFQASLVLGKPA